MAHYRVWQIISLGFLCIGVSELVLRGLLQGSRAGVVIGVVSLIASASGFWEGYVQWRRAEQRLAEIRRAGAAQDQQSLRHQQYEQQQEQPGLRR
ncbi:hypothetical protein [Kineosporia sp. NBRC 101677]|uniref:hypothetical protein n=1 Tax=Kineosporia sp. NBRC 101677 TaxID=3032197 RepID=UPI002552657C|nr:hypothetical protein [Kineosporia sp. NBRC 101677]